MDIAAEMKAECGHQAADAPARQRLRRGVEDARPGMAAKIAVAAGRR